MSNSMDKAKLKRKNRNRFVILLMIYFMFISLLAGITYGNSVFGDDPTGYTIATIVLVSITILYWVIFYIIIRRSNQKGGK